MDTFETYFNSALHFLSFRSRSEKEVIDNLKKKKVNPAIIEKIINKLKEHNFINDVDFAKMWIESRTRFKPRSIKLIILELKQKGISQEIIDTIIHPPAGESLIIQNDLEQAKTLVRKKLPRYQNLTKQELYQKLGGFLARRGFNWDTIKQSIDEVMDKGV